MDELFEDGPVNQFTFKHGFSLSQGTKYILCSLSFSTGRGRVRYMYGSKVMDIWWERLLQTLAEQSRYARYLLTFGTNQCAPVLSLEQVDNDAVIALHVALPRLVCERN